jgi:glutaminyl-tRNA synthetase
VRWLGFDCGTTRFYASDYFEQLYDWREQLVARARPTSSSDEEEMREYRGTLTDAGRNSPTASGRRGREPGPARRMRAGEFEDGTHVLRAKIDMASPNMNMRDPLLYRIRTRTITAPATPGASIRCTTTRTG